MRSLTMTQSLTHRKSSIKSVLFDCVSMFVICGTIGTLYEVVLTLTLRGVIEDRSGSILTPFNYVYGTGSLVIFLALQNFKHEGALFVAGTLLGGAFEYALSWIQETILGSRSWDYSTKFLNIQGRTTIPYMILWGALCFVLMRYLFPVLLKINHEIPFTARKTIGILLAVVICIDVLITGTAVVRYTQRTSGVYVSNVLCQWVDTRFSDSFMKIHFPTMIFKS